ncbi:MAG TPA: LamG domain-containing protein [Planctomycetota bacterium]|nr:LamG domain-containing protein [Planctomycetota bacterium]
MKVARWIGAAALAAAALASPAAGVTALPQDGLVAYLPMDGDFHDRTANRLDGFNGGASFVSDGRFGEAGHFAGATVELPASDLFRFAGGSFTISLWVREPAMAGGYDTQLFFQDPADGAPWIYFQAHPAYGFFFDVYNGGGPRAFFPASGVTVADGAWHNLLAEEDQAGGTASYYIDGQLVGSQAYAAFAFGSAPAIDLGSAGGGAPMTGDLDEVAIWSRALTGDEIAAVAAGTYEAAGAGGGAVPEPASLALALAGAVAASSIGASTRRASKHRSATSRAARQAAG